MEKEKRPEENAPERRISSARSHNTEPSRPCRNVSYEIINRFSATPVHETLGNSCGGRPTCAQVILQPTWSPERKIGAIAYFTSCTSVRRYLSVGKLKLPPSETLRAAVASETRVRRLTAANLTHLRQSFVEIEFVRRLHPELQSVQRACRSAVR